MKICSNCGAQLMGNANYCPSCGNAVSTETDTQSDTTQQFQQDVYQGSGELVMMAQDIAGVTADFDPIDIEKNKTMGGLAYFIFFLPLIACPDSKYARFHANQSLLLLVLGLAARVVTSLVRAILPWPLILISPIFSFILFTAIIIIGIRGLINGFSGKVKELPIIGKYRLIK